VAEEQPTRRSLLVGLLAGAALLPGCSPDHPASPDHATRLVNTAVRREQALLARCHATADRHPDLAHRLAPLVSDHEDHLAALGHPVGGTGGASATAAGTPASTGASPSPTPPPVPASPDAATAAVADAERRAASSTLDGLEGAPGQLARLLASVAAAESSHHALLTTAPVS